MANLLVGKLAVILEDVVVLCAGGDGNLLCNGLRILSAGPSVLCLGLPQRSYQELDQVLVWDIRQLLAMMLGNNQLQRVSDLREPAQLGMWEQGDDE